MDAVAASSRLSSASAVTATAPEVNKQLTGSTSAGGGGKSLDDTTQDSAADADEVPTLSSLASEAIGDELPAARVLRRLQPPTGKLIAITKNMNHHLTSLLVRILALQFNILQYIGSLKSYCNIVAILLQL